MVAFDRIKSGIPEMDRALDNIRLGDNVVRSRPQGWLTSRGGLRVTQKNL